MSIELFKKTDLGNFESVLVDVDVLQDYLDSGYLLSPESKEENPTESPKKRGRKPKVESDAIDES